MVERETEIRRRVHETIRQYDIVEYAELLDVLLELDADMYNYACTHTIMFNAYINSRRYSK